MDHQFDLFLGIDWGSTEHVLTMLDAEGQLLGQRRFEHCGRGLGQLLQWLQTHLIAHGRGHWARLAVAIETIHGALWSCCRSAGPPSTPSTRANSTAFATASA